MLDCGGVGWRAFFPPAPASYELETPFAVSQSEVVLNYLQAKFKSTIGRNQQIHALAGLRFS
jgi:hypothetical protein